MESFRKSVQCGIILPLFDEAHVGLKELGNDSEAASNNDSRTNFRMR
jgi:hypothetical protein